MVRVNRMETSKPHRTRARVASIVEGEPRSLEDVKRMARSAQRKLRREMQERPEVVLAAVAGASFVAGAAVGSRVGRIVLSALIPFGLQHLLTTRVAPRLAGYLTEWMHDDRRANGTAASAHAS
jgi:hypothetical protein